MLFICFHMANISSRIFRSDSELYGSFGKWNPMVAFLMWLPNGNFHIVYMLKLILYCRIYTRKICLYRQYILYNISFMCAYMRVCVCVYVPVPVPIQCAHEWQWRLNKRMKEHTHTDTENKPYIQCTERLSYIWKRVELGKLSKYLFNIYIQSSLWDKLNEHLREA